MKEISILDKEIIQANPLIRARKKMNVTEMRLFALGLQDIHPHIKGDKIHDIDFHETFISYGDLMALFDDKNNGNIAYFKKNVEKAYDGKIELSREDGGFGFRHIYRKIDYIPKKGLILQFDDEIKPYILDILNQQFTKFKIKAFFNLSSPYAWRLLESLLEKQGYLRQGKPMIYVDLTIEEIRFRFNVPDNKYKDRLDNFKHKVLDAPIKQINDKTDYYVWYDNIKKGRKIVGYRFWLKLKKEIAPIAPADLTEREQTLQLTSSSVTAKRANGKEIENNDIEKNDMEDVYKGLSVENFFRLPEIVFTEELTIDPLEEQVEKNKNIDIGDGEVERWTEEQQADYDKLFKIGMWPNISNKIVNTYDHTQIERNYKGVMQDYKKGTIANLPAVVRNAIENDTYNGVEEEKQKVAEREQARRKAEWEKAQQAEKEREERIAKERAEEEEMAKIREQYTADVLNKVMEEIKIECNNNGDLTEEMEAKLKKYGINNRQFYFYRTNGKKIKDDLRTNNIEKVIPENEIKIDFEINLQNEKSIEKIIKAYYENGKKCPEEILKELEKQGLTWGFFQSKYYEKFIVIGKGM